MEAKTLRRIKVIHVHFKKTGLHIYYGSISAIYKNYSKQDMGISRNALYREYLPVNGEYENEKIKLRKSYLNN